MFLSYDDQNSGFPINGSTFYPSPNFQDEVMALNLKHDEGSSGSAARLDPRMPMTIVQNGKEITLNPTDLIKLLLQSQQEDQ